MGAECKGRPFEDVLKDREGILSLMLLDMVILQGEEDAEGLFFLAQDLNPTPLVISSQTDEGLGPIFETMFDVEELEEDQATIKSTEFGYGLSSNLSKE